MVTSFNGLTGTQVTIAGGAGCPVPNSAQTIININGTGNGAVQDAYTVTAGKSLAVFTIEVDKLAGGTSLILFKNDGTTRLMSIANVVNEISPVISSAIPIWIYTSTQIVKVNAANGAGYNIVGVEY